MSSRCSEADTKEPIYTNNGWEYNYKLECEQMTTSQAAYLLHSILTTVAATYPELA